MSTPLYGQLEIQLSLDTLGVGMPLTGRQIELNAENELNWG